MSEFAELQRIELGAVEVLFLPDGGGRSDPLSLFPASDAVAWSLHKKWLDAQGRVVTSIGSFALRFADHIVLVDTGIGPVSREIEGLGQVQGGRLLDGLRSAGIAAEDVTEVFFTHLHLEQTGWALDPERDRLRFSNARHLLHAREWAHWALRDDPAGPSPALRSELEAHAGLVMGGDEIAPGLRVVEAFGHTPGHCMLLLEPGGEERLYLLGDLLHTPPQIEHASWNSVFDADPVAAQDSRDGVYPMLTSYGTKVAAGRFPSSVFGEIRGMGYGRMWLPGAIDTGPAAH